MNDGPITQHFFWKEALHSQAAILHKIDNRPLDGTIVNNIIYAASCMEIVRCLLGGVSISIAPNHSWYRNPVVNKMIGGASNSAHMSGLAIDFSCPAFGPPEAIVRHLLTCRDRLKWNQLICEVPKPAEPSNGWVHIGFAPAGVIGRGEVLRLVVVDGANKYSTFA
jgi:hypothetical protein